MYVVCMYLLLVLFLWRTLANTGDFSPFDSLSPALWTPCAPYTQLQALDSGSLLSPVCVQRRPVPKGVGLDSQSGHMPRVRVWLPVWVCKIPGLDTYGRQPIDASLLHRCFPLSLPLSLKAMEKKSP